MAIFIENVLTANIKKKHQVLGERAAFQEMRIKEVVHKLVMRETSINAIEQTDGRINKTDIHKRTSMADWYTTDQNKSKALQDRMAEIADNTKELVDEDILISREVFNVWLQDPEMLAVLEEVEIETSTKFELFDVLDVDEGGELSFDELVSGLMCLRGPHSKCDVVSVRLQVRYVAQLVEKVLLRLDDNVPEIALQDAPESERKLSHISESCSSQSNPEDQGIG